MEIKSHLLRDGFFHLNHRTLGRGGGDRDQQGSTMGRARTSCLRKCPELPTAVIAPSGALPALPAGEDELSSELHVAAQRTRRPAEIWKSWRPRNPEERFRITPTSVLGILSHAKLFLKNPDSSSDSNSESLCDLGHRHPFSGSLFPFPK